MDTTELLAFASTLADAAAAQTCHRFRQGSAIDNKRPDGFDPVTEADRQAEQALRQVIEARYPDHGILGEELPDKLSDSEWRWVLDPVDGTRAFICGIPTWTTLIGLERHGEPVFGIIDQPWLQERWVGSLINPSKPALEVRGAPAAGTSACENLNEARLMVTDVRVGEYFSAEEGAAVANLTRHVRLTRQGLDSYGFGLVASGQMDLVVEAGLLWHDIAAVIPVINAAGGVVVDWQCRNVSADSARLQVIAAATPALAAEAARALKS